jgi:hypothetical protein
MNTTSHPVLALPRADLLTAAPRSPYRFVLAVAAVVAAVAHIPVTGPHLREAPYWPLCARTGRGGVLPAATSPVRDP